MYTQTTAGMNYNEGFSSGDRKATHHPTWGEKIDRLEYTTHGEERKIDSHFRVDSSRINKKFGPLVRAKSGDGAAAPEPSRAGASDSGDESNGGGCGQ